MKILKCIKSSTQRLRQVYSQRFSVTRGEVNMMIESYDVAITDHYILTKSSLQSKLTLYDTN